jgi:hypothetical protein
MHMQEEEDSVEMMGEKALRNRNCENPEYAVKWANTM